MCVWHFPLESKKALSKLFTQVTVAKKYLPAVVTGLLMFVMEVKRRII